MRIHRFIDPKQRDAAKSAQLIPRYHKSASLRTYRELDKAGKHVIAQTGSDRYLEQNVPNAIP